LDGKSKLAQKARADASNAIGYAMHYSRSADAVICVMMMLAT